MADKIYEITGCRCRVGKTVVEVGGVAGFNAVGGNGIIWLTWGGALMMASRLALVRSA